VFIYSLNYSSNIGGSSGYTLTVCWASSPTLALAVAKGPLWSSVKQNAGVEVVEHFLLFYFHIQIVLQKLAVNSFSCTEFCLCEHCYS